MPTTGKAAAGKEDKAEAMSFEAALKKLEGIVEAMEEGELPLETLLAKFEEGTRLVKSCQSKLDEAELKIKKLEKGPAGELIAKPVAAETLEQDE